MSAADGIRKLGFRRWYERKLIESHVHLVTCLLCMILVAVCLEALTFPEGGLPRTLLMLSLAAAGAVLGFLSWQRFKSMFGNVLRLSEASTCGACGVYARFEVTASGIAGAHALAADGIDQEWLGVKCRKCGHEWTLGERTAAQRL